MADPDWGAVLTQNTRLLQLETTLPPGTLIPERCTVHEAVNAEHPFLAELDCVSTHSGIPLTSLMGTAATLQLRLHDGGWRGWHGHVARAEHLSFFSGQDTSLSTQGDAHLTAAHTLSAISGQTTSLYTHAGGIHAIAANATLSLRAHTDAQHLWADRDITAQSTTDEVRVFAQDSITLTAGQSQIQLKGGDITFTCPGSFTVKGSTHEWGGGASGASILNHLPDSRAKIYKEQFRAVDQSTGTPIRDLPYRIEMEDGTQITGQTDENGHTQVIQTAQAQRLKVAWLPIEECVNDTTPSVVWGC